jgi:hypothetical protein
MVDFFSSETTWTAISAIVTFLGFLASICFFKKNEADKKQTQEKQEQEKIKNAAIFVLLDIEHMDKQKLTLQAMVERNQCDLHFYKSLMSGCGANVWAQYKGILLNNGLDRYQVEMLESYYSISCDVDDHLKRCRSDFYKVIRAQVVFECGTDDAPQLTKYSAYQLYRERELTPADYCVTPREVVEYIKNELAKLPDLSSLKTALNKISA